LQLDRFDFDRAYVERLVAGDAETEQHFARYFVICSPSSSDLACGRQLKWKTRARKRSGAC
jgi:hypothetical protein